ncbi:DUF1996 domain-containing protein [Streptomyces sp. 7N604]|uniref:DUF1996 domain-containing protein n=1 Tax=Streptomyces sp. 7N604 TaxID=3457415 RepID=UPI003FD673DA
MRDQITEVPQDAQPEVDNKLAELDTQVGDAYEKMVQNRDAAESDPNFVQNSVLDPLAEQRRTTIDDISSSIGNDAPEGLDQMAECQLKEGGAVADDGQNQADDGQVQDGGQDQGGEDQAGQDQGGGEAQAGGPSPEDFVDITQVEPNVQEPQEQQGASTGTFTTNCGVNENANRNSDNVIVAPGVSNGAQHMHDYVGNQETGAFVSDDDLANGDTSCQNQGDQSTYFWPVLRVQDGQDEQDANAPGGGQDGNIGTIQTPSEVTLELKGNPAGDVVAMPRFLRIITGDAKAFTNGDANANASWSCTGFEDQVQLKDKYPLCPEGEQVVRTSKFQSCWDGQNIDSANHRTHVDFANEDGSCDNGFQAIPQLVQRLVYDVQPEPNFAVDSFPDQLHKPITDHGDFINVFSEDLMQEAVDCINEGRQCQ